MPAEVPYGADSDDLAIFSGSPRAYIQQDDEAWENLDPVLNQVIGYGATPEIISQRIGRGKFGMDGMYSWLKVCVEELNISEGLLEGKIERLIDAMLLLYVHSLPSITLFHISSHFSRGARQGPTSVAQPPQAETIIHEVLESDSPPLGILPPPSLDIRCPGYGLKMPHSQSPFVSYPFFLHSIKTLPWKVEVSDA